MSATIRCERGRWHMSFTVEQDVPEPPVKAGPVVGVDLGIKHLAVLSTGEKIENPRHLSASLRKLGRPSRAVSRRQGPDR